MAEINFFIFFTLLLSYYYEGGVMVRVSVHKGTVGEGPERSSLVTALLLGEEETVEYFSVLCSITHGFDSETALRGLGKIAVDLDYVENVPVSAVLLRSHAGGMDALKGIEEICSTGGLDAFLGVQPYFLALILGVVIHISHNDYLDTGIFLFHSPGVVVYDLGAAGAQVGAFVASAGRQMGYVECEMLAFDCPVSHKDIPCPESLLLLMR